MKTVHLNRVGRLAGYALLLAMMGVVATGLLASSDDSVQRRPPAPLIRQQVADILSQPEYQQEYPMWLMKLLARPMEWLVKLIARLLERLVSAARSLYEMPPALKWVIGGLLVVTLLALLFHIFITIMGAFGRPRRRQSATQPSPLPLTSPAALRRQAHQLARAGDWASALRKLYQACLRYLDQQGYLYYHPATTNGEYLREVDEYPGLTACFQPITRAMDRLCYAHIGVGRSTYQHLDTLAQRLWQEAESQQ